MKHLEWNHDTRTSWSSPAYSAHCPWKQCMKTKKHQFPTPNTSTCQRHLLTHVYLNNYFQPIKNINSLTNRQSALCVCFFVCLFFCVTLTSTPPLWALVGGLDFDSVGMFLAQGLVLLGEERLPLQAGLADLQNHTTMAWVGESESSTGWLKMLNTKWCFCHSSFLYKRNEPLNQNHIP